MFAPKSFRTARVVASALMLVTAARHVVLALRGDESVARHNVFAVINVLLAVVLIVRPRWALYPTAILAVQQLWSHGTDLVVSVQGEGPLDVMSIGVCLFFLALMSLLVLEQRAAARRSPTK